MYPPLHIKLGLMKQFVKALNTYGECLQHIFSVLPGLSFEKIMAGDLMDHRFVHLCVIKNLPER